MANGSREVELLREYRQRRMNRLLCQYDAVAQALREAEALGHKNAPELLAEKSDLCRRIEFQRVAIATESVT